eukprot:gene9532-1738_t
MKQDVPPRTSISEDKLLLHRNKRKTRKEEKKMKKKAKPDLKSIADDLLYGTSKSELNDFDSSGDDRDDDFDIYKVKDLLDFAPEKKRKKLSEEKKHAEVFKEKKKPIQMKDLISSIDQQEAKVLGGDEFSNLKENLKSLSKIEKEKQRGEIFEVVDDHILQKNEKRSAFDLVDEKMLKWKPIVDHVTESKRVPIFYQENEERKEKYHQAGDLSKKDDFDVSLDASVDKKPSYKRLTVKEMKDPLKITKEEVIKRSKEIAQHRRLMLSQQVKLARIKRIKSKAYRKRAKKELEKHEEIQEEIGNLDPEEAARKLLQQEKAFLRERATMRHKNSSKWVRKAMKRRDQDPEIQKSVSEQARLARDLLRKQTQTNSESEDSDEDELVDELLENGEETIEKLRKDLNESDEENKDEKGLFQMQFMKNAERKKLDRHQQLLDELQEEFIEEKKDETGRRSFKAKAGLEEFPESSSEEEQEEKQVEKEKKLIKVQQPTKKRKQEIDTENPWLERIEENENRKTKYQKRADEDVESEVKVNLKESDDESESSDDENESENEDDVFNKKIKKEAFAGDDLELEFKLAKQKAIDEEINLPGLDSKVQPGWGSWTGKGTNSEVKMKRIEKKIHQVKEELRDNKKKERKDTKISNVIIRSTAAVPSQYLADTKDFKFDYEKRIHDNQIAHPLGLEWNTYMGHKSMNEPRIETKKGKIIKPIDYKSASSMLEFREDKKKVKAQKKGVVFRDNQISDQLKASEDEFKQIKSEREAKRSKDDLLSSKTLRDHVEKERREHIVTMDSAGESVRLEKKKYKK